MESIEVASAAVGATAALSKDVFWLLVQRMKPFNDRKSRKGVMQAHFHMRTCQLKFQAWLRAWSGQKQQRDVSLEILPVLEAIICTCSQLEKPLVEMRENEIAEETENAQQRSKIMAALRFLRSQLRLTLYGWELNRLIKDLEQHVDNLQPYSKSLLNPRQGGLGRELALPSRDMLLKSAILSRRRSVQLYDHCYDSSDECLWDWYIELDLFAADMKPSTLLHGGDGSSLHLFYQLFSCPSWPETAGKAFRKVVVESIPKEHASNLQDEHVREPVYWHIDIFKNRSPPAILAIWSPPNWHLGCQFSPHQKRRDNLTPEDEFLVTKPATARLQGSACFRVEQDWPADVQLISEPASLATLLDARNYATNLSRYGDFSWEAKVELAYKIVECGLFLLGTPWFSLIRIRSIVRLTSNEESRHNFVLKVPNLGPHFFLSEVSQLFSIGVLLTEIALDSPGRQRVDDIDPMSRLGQVMRTMGYQYARATAFCLQHGALGSEFLSQNGKYLRYEEAKWFHFLSQFLPAYHSGVFLPLEKLRRHITK